MLRFRRATDKLNILIVIFAILTIMSLVYGIRKDVKKVHYPTHITTKSADCWGIGVWNYTTGDCITTVRR